ncbi:OLC1v1018032C2 [Oldenlandia corymbosa var. corymbosa]|uniref:OLC1v1018032C2 n=1 Tax=Oldenlandia corymbosa var. corymbosa TaxID=529605 RepID=A0AAV1EB31_OLDCO|nr:OLC1v1018032C2 [Oldenlandia corymbosa var. corymbosa]
MLTELFSGSGVHFGGCPWPAPVDEVDPDVVFHFGDGSKIEAEEQVSQPVWWKLTCLDKLPAPADLKSCIFVPRSVAESLPDSLKAEMSDGTYALEFLIDFKEKAEIKSGNENEFPFGTAPLDCCVDPDSEVILPWEVDGSSFTFEEPQASTEYTPLIVEPEVKKVFSDFSTGFNMPPRPREILSRHQHSYLNNKNKFSSRTFLFFDDKDSPGFYPQIEKGTTTFGFILRDWVFVAADCSLSSSYPKLVALPSHMVAAISGGRECLLEKLRRKCERKIKEGGTVTVEEASKWMADIVAPLKIPVAVLIAGWDETLHCPLLYHVNCFGEVENCAKKRDKNIVGATGSGAGSCVGYFDAKYFDATFREDMSETEAVELAKNTICYGACNAIESGDFARGMVAILTPIVSM